MKYMSLQEIAAACGGTYYGGSEFLPREVSSVVIDSRKAEKDSLFIAIRGATRRRTFLYSESNGTRSALRRFRRRSRRCSLFLY